MTTNIILFCCRIFFNRHWNWESKLSKWGTSADY